MSPPSNEHERAHERYSEFSFLRVERREEIALVWIDVPGEKVNTLRAGFEEDLERVLDELSADSGVEGVVLASAKEDNFVVGADVELLAEIDSAGQAETLSRRAQQAMSRLEDFRAPTVAAIRGACLGGGLELALACDSRIAAEDAVTRLGQPEVQLGLIPGAGGTQRLPRLIGLEAALELILTGRRVPAGRALALGLVDEIVHPKIVVAAAVSRARLLAGADSGSAESRWGGKLHKALSPEHVRNLLLADNPAGRKFLFRQAKKKTLDRTHGNLPAPLRALDVIRIGIEQGMKAGLDAEARAFGELVVSQEARSLLELFFARQELKKEPGADEPPRPVRKVGIVGAGLMGSGIAYITAAGAGVPVRLKDVELDQVREGLRSIDSILSGQVKKGSLTPRAREQILARVRTTTDYSGFRSADLVIEAVPEDLQLKWQVLSDVEERTGDEAVFASNTSSLPIDRIASRSRRPERVVGMHYFSPAHKVPLLEVIAGRETAPAVVATAVEFGKRQGKIVIVVRDGPGFYTSRILAPYVSEAGHLAGEGVPIDVIDRTLVERGFPIGPLHLLDEVGIDVAHEIAKVLHESLGERMRPAPLLEKLVDNDRYGKKNGRGLYRYRRRDRGFERVDREVDRSVYSLMDVSPETEKPPDEIADRCLLQMVNEAARCYEDGILRSVRDGDAGAVFGLGFPPFLGGPFRYINHRGATEIIRRLEEFRERHGNRFEPAPLLKEMADKGRRFHQERAKRLGPRPSPTPAAEESTPEPEPSSSFSKALFRGEIHDDRVFPYPGPDANEQGKIETLIRDAREFAEKHYDPRRAEQEGWVGDDIIAGFGERGLLGLHVSESYSGQGLSQTGYCRVMEAIGEIDPTLAVVFGVHQSLGMKGIHLFGSDEQKQRFLPDLATGRKLAGFALTEPNAGSDAFHIQTRVERKADGGYRLDGEKRWIGNGSKDVLVTFARTDAGAHVACLIEKGMEGFEVGRAYETMGLRANDLRHLYFRGVHVPRENVLGNEGDGFRMAMEILNNGRMSLGAGTIGGAKVLLRKGIDHVLSREQFGRRLADFPLVEEKIAWIVTYLYGLESMTYLTTGLVDRGIPDYSVESAMVKLSSTEFIWYAANRVFQLAGGQAYMRDQPYEKILRDLRIFPIFEGANDVMRVFIALSGLRALAEELSELRHLDLARPLASLGVLADYADKRIRREFRRPRVTRAHPELSKLAAPLSDQVGRLRETSERLLRKHGEEIEERQGQLKRLAHAVTDIYAQFATISRVSAVLGDGNGSVSAEQRDLAETFCCRAAHRVERSLDRIESNDDDDLHAIARATYERRDYGF